MIIFGSGKAKRRREKKKKTWGRIIRAPDFGGAGLNLPRRPLTNVDLRRFARQLRIPNFRGVYMRDSLPKLIRRNECGILNLDDRAGDGTHWTAYAKRGPQVKYFDSIGHLKPPPEAIKYFKSDGAKNTITYNFARYQNFDTFNCGHLCLKFLYNQAQTG